jgi:hypothetical protein
MTEYVLQLSVQPEDPQSNDVITPLVTVLPSILSNTWSSNEAWPLLNSGWLHDSEFQTTGDQLVHIFSHLSISTITH